jgi:hypothetical protein
MHPENTESAGERDGGEASGSGQRMGRRQLLQGTAAVAGGIALAAYTPPTLRRLGPAVALAVSGPELPGPVPPVQGSPGFWKDGGNGQTSLWNSLNDLDWKGWAQKLGLTSATPANPFVKTDLFTSIFVTHPDLVDLTMQQVIDEPKNSTDAQKAARALVAAYLNASLYGSNYPYTQAQLKSMWEQAVSDNSHASFETLKSELETTYN